MSTAPAEGRGGAGNPLAQLKSKKGLRKAPESSVVKDMGAELAASEEAPAPPVLAAAPPVLEPAVTEAPIALAPAVTAPSEPVPAAKEPAASPAAEEPAPRASETATVEKKKMGVWVPADVVERVRNAYGPTSRLEGHRSLSDLAARALEAEASRLEEKYNDGRPFPPDEIGIPRGRPLR